MPASKRPFYLIVAILLLLAGIRIIELGMIIGGSLCLLAAAILFHRSYQTPPSS